MADVALAGQVIASHYAEPVARRLNAPEALRSGPGDDAAVLQRLDAGDPFLMLDDSMGWAWGYAGADKLVGYVPSCALTA